MCANAKVPVAVDQQAALSLQAVSQEQKVQHNFFGYSPTRVMQKTENVPFAIRMLRLKQVGAIGISAVAAYYCLKTLAGQRALQVPQVFASTGPWYYAPINWVKFITPIVLQMGATQLFQSHFGPVIQRINGCCYAETNLEWFYNDQTSLAMLMPDLQEEVELLNDVESSREITYSVDIIKAKVPSVVEDVMKLLGYMKYRFAQEQESYAVNAVTLGTIIDALEKETQEFCVVIDAALRDCEDFTDGSLDTSLNGRKKVRTIVAKFALTLQKAFGNFWYFEKH